MTDGEPIVVSAFDVEPDPNIPGDVCEFTPGQPPHCRRAHTMRPLGSAWRQAIEKARARIERERRQ